MPILIAGSSSGTVSATPSNPAVNLSTGSFAGSRLTLKTSGTNSNGSVAVSWGHSYLNGVPPYTNYASTYLLRASVLSGAYVPGQNTVSLYVVIQGDSHVPCASNPTGTGVTGTASAQIDPYLYIDPTWLAAAQRARRDGRTFEAEILKVACRLGHLGARFSSQFHAPSCRARSTMLVATTSKSPDAAVSGTPAEPPPNSFGR